MTTEGDSNGPAAATVSQAGSFHVVAGTRTETPRYIWALLGAMVFLWSINFVVAKITLREFPAVFAGALRFTIAGAIVGPVWLWRERNSATPRLDARSFLSVFALGVIGVGVNQFCFILGMANTSVAHASIVVALAPMIVLVLAALIGQERLTARKAVGLAIAFTGVALLQAMPSKAGGASLLGDFFIFLSALTFALFTVFGKHVRSRFSGLTVNTFAYVGSSILLLPLTLWSAANFSFAEVAWKGWAGVIYMATFPSLLCYMIYFHALHYIPATRISTISYSQPLLATIFAVTLLGESLSGSLIAGGLLVLFGVFLTERS